MVHLLQVAYAWLQVVLLDGFLAHAAVEECIHPLLHVDGRCVLSSSGAISLGVLCFGGLVVGVVVVSTAALLVGLVTRSVV